jgi:hypothetical protein
MFRRPGSGWRRPARGRTGAADACSNSALCTEIAEITEIAEKNLLLLQLRFFAIESGDLRLANRHAGERATNILRDLMFLSELCA